MQGMHSAPKPVLFLVFFCASVSAFSARGAKVESISGRIVAYADPLTCLNGNAYWSMIIHVQDPSDPHSEFIQVSFSLPCSKAPEWLTAKPSSQKFHLIREKDPDSVLQEFMECSSESPSSREAQPCSPVPIWKHVPDTERDRLPFGQRVPCYRSVDLPLTPAI
jgi:hypothetical protein